jgi:hypothetical protein
MMRACDVPQEAHRIIDKFEETGDIIYWTEFGDYLRKRLREVSPSQSAASAIESVEPTDSVVTDELERLRPGTGP